MDWRDAWSTEEKHNIRAYLLHCIKFTSHLISLLSILTFIVCEKCSNTQVTEMTNWPSNWLTNKLHGAESLRI
jgi:hypothetical protein